MDFKNTEYNFSFYKDIYLSTPNTTLDINQLIEVVKYGYLKNEVIKIRNIADKKERNKEKLKLPAVTLSGVFKERNNNNLIKHSGLLQIDIDEVKQYDKVFNQVVNDTYSYLVFRSPSGNGIKVIVKINPYEDTHFEQFCAFEKYYLETYDIKVDSACKDISRCMFLSYDPNLFCNPFSHLFSELYVPEVVLGKPNNLSSNNSVQSNDSHIKSLMDQIEKRCVDITGLYTDWFRIGYAFVNKYGEEGREYFHRVSKFHKNYNPSETDKMFSVLLKSNNGSISIGTFIYYARKNGVE